MVRHLFSPDRICVIIFLLYLPTRSATTVFTSEHIRMAAHAPGAKKRTSGLATQGLEAGFTASRLSACRKIFSKKRLDDFFTTHYLRSHVNETRHIFHPVVAALKRAACLRFIFLSHKHTRQWLY
ncbi:hypothetical protein LJC23_04880 [Desulfovibrio sp. OttesenSCG-928-I05]|nr:hypothetical protein [Desulfovibrio sp. OttesenSCG-928-I05]